MGLAPIDVRTSRSLGADGVEGIRVERMLRDGYGSRVYAVAAEFSPLKVPSILKVTHGGARHTERLVRVADALRGSKELHARFGAIVPRTIRLTPNAVLQERAQGLTYEQLTPAAQKRADAERRDAALLAADVFPEVYSTWKGNFFYRADGSLSAWYDFLSDTAKSYVRAGLPTPDNFDDGGALKGGIDGLGLPRAATHQGTSGTSFYRATPARGGEVALVVFDPQAARHAAASLAALQRLDGVSPHIPRLVAHDVKDDTIRVAMQAGGMTLSVLPAQPRDVWVRLLASLARTLAKAHASGVTHGAVKADHVVANPTDPSGRYLLIGWGESVTGDAPPPARIRDLQDLARMGQRLLAGTPVGAGTQQVLRDAADGKYADGEALAAALNASR